MLKCLVVEDDPGSQENVIDILENNVEDIAVYAACNLKEGEQLFFAQNPNLLILDVNLPDGTSFDLLNKIYQSPHQFKIIFTTAFSDYAVEAFKFSALDYLLKPFLPGELVNSVQRAIQELEQQDYKKQLEVFFQSYQQTDQKPKKMVLKTTDHIHIIETDEILQAKSDNNYTIFHMADGREIMVAQPLKSYDQRLSPLGFMRVHQSHLVNLQHVKTFQKRQDTLVLANKVQVPVAQSKKARLVDFLENMQF